MPKAVLWVESTGVHWSPYGLWGGQKSIGQLGKWNPASFKPAEYTDE